MKYYEWMIPSSRQPKEDIKCECGAHKTENPNCHARWCPCFCKDVFETDSGNNNPDSCDENNCKSCKGCK